QHGQGAPGGLATERATGKGRAGAEVPQAQAVPNCEPAAHAATVSHEAARLVEEEVRQVTTGQDPVGTRAANDVTEKVVVLGEHESDPPGLRALKQPVSDRRVKASGGAARTNTRRQRDGGEDIGSLVGGIERHVPTKRLKIG